ncbi:MAG TPA: MerR family transcriptional regulator [Polyangiaceae bacterium]|jgi:DNA-binding transcriptional MerR regulator|nr:MerR family transcriptional regulator [Polyangiaceae bacterium]HNZ25246.1 MerR family transcriptional regulator [Polyangiaceae bacterium]HOD24839.1 MerR family transcriptional regulator [Polyangiaceae bacterium]HOE51440.1 MerR family transcriptional regulator [Polyangiaceae bacterium]HOH03349.1 MerR family transcriptional regulator [Polyangiaceae bacterium]
MDTVTFWRYYLRIIWCKMLDDPKEMKLAELAKRSEVPARTIRLYLSMGLLPGPLRVGRNAAYGVEHLEGLAKIRQLQRSGLTLHQVREVLYGEKAAGPEALPEFARWREYELASDFRILMRDDGVPSRMRVLQQALRELQGWLRSNHDATATMSEEANEDEH